MDAMLIDRQAYENGVSQIIQTSLIDVYGVEGYKSIIKTMIKESGKSEKEVTQNYQIFADVIQRIFGRIGDAKILEPIKMEINKFQINHTNALEKTSDTSNKQIRLLIADDEPHLLELYQDWLKFDNRHVITAENGQKCLEIYQKEHIYSKLNNLENYFDVVILDHNMPVLNGVQTASEILKINPHQRIIFASGYLERILIESLNTFNKVIEVIKKPFSIEVLDDMIKNKTLLDKLEVINSMQKDSTTRYENAITILNSHNSF